jgi:GTP-binding protein
VLVADVKLSTLLDLHHRRHIKGEPGAHGGHKQKTGKSGRDAVFTVPAGTLVYDDETGEQLGDLSTDRQRLIVAKSGRGGRGNMHFKSSTRRAPDYAERGRPGQIRMIRLELKLLADVGIVGFPSVGKSTLISRISNAKPKIAEYPFTTLVPNLGLVAWHDHQSFVVADLPGLIEGAHRGVGLGHRFLKHLERTRVLVHMLQVPLEGSCGFGSKPDPLAAYAAIRKELELFDEQFSDRPEIVVLNKIDLLSDDGEISRLSAHFQAKGIEFVAISAATRQNLDTLISAMAAVVFSATDSVEPDGDLIP